MDFDQDVLMFPIFFDEAGSPLSAEQIWEDIVGKANCGCVYHAEEGIPCEHDIALYLGKETPQGGLNFRP